MTPPTPTLALNGAQVSSLTDDCGICGTETCRHDGAPHPWTSVAQVQAVVEASNRDLLEALEGILKSTRHDLPPTLASIEAAREALAHARGGDPNE